MASTVSSASSQASRKHVELSLELKRKLIQEHEHGVPFTLLGKKYHIATSTAANIWRKKDFFLRSRMSGSRKRCNDRSKYKIVNQVTALFVKSMLERNHKIDGEVIKRFARTAAAQCNFKDFHGSNGWLDSFKKRENVCWVRRRGTERSQGAASAFGSSGAVSAASASPTMPASDEHAHQLAAAPQLAACNSDGTDAPLAAASAPNVAALVNAGRSDSPNLGSVARAAALAATSQPDEHAHHTESDGGHAPGVAPNLAANPPATHSSAGFGLGGNLAGSGGGGQLRQIKSSPGRFGLAGESTQSSSNQLANNAGWTPADHESGGRGGCARCNVAAAAAAIAALSSSDCIHERDHEIEDWFHGIPFLCHFFEEYQTMHQQQASPEQPSSATSSIASATKQSSTGSLGSSTSGWMGLATSDVATTSLARNNDTGSAHSSGSNSTSTSSLDMPTALSFELDPTSTSSGQSRAQIQQCQQNQQQDQQQQLELMQQAPQHAQHRHRQGLFNARLGCQMTEMLDPNQQQQQQRSHPDHQTISTVSMDYNSDDQEPYLTGTDSCFTITAGNQQHQLQQRGQHQLHSQQLQQHQNQQHPQTQLHHNQQQLDNHSSDELLYNDEVSDHIDCCSDHYDPSGPTSHELQLANEYQSELLTSSSGAIYIDEYEYENISTIRHYPVLPMVPQSSSSSSSAGNGAQFHLGPSASSAKAVGSNQFSSLRAVNSSNSVSIVETESNSIANGQHPAAQHQQSSCENGDNPNSCHLGNNPDSCRSPTQSTSGIDTFMATLASGSGMGMEEALNSQQGLMVANSSDTGVASGGYSSLIMGLQHDEHGIEHADHEEHNLLHNALMRSPEKLKLIDSIITLLNYASNYNQKMLPPLLEIKRCIERDLEVVLSDTSDQQQQQNLQQQQQHQHQQQQQSPTHACCQHEDQSTSHQLNHQQQQQQQASSSCRGDASTMATCTGHWGPCHSMSSSMNGVHTNGLGVDLLNGSAATAMDT